MFDIFRCAFSACSWDLGYYTNALLLSVRRAEI